MDTDVTTFRQAQDTLMHRVGITARSIEVPAPSVEGTAHVLVTGEGPPLVMVIGGAIPAALWAPLLPHLPGRTLYAVDLPGFGLTTPVGYSVETVRSLAVDFLGDVLEELDVAQAPFVTQSQGSLWTMWFAEEHPDRVVAQSVVACPAHVLGTTAPVPMRLMSIGALGRLMLRLQPPSRRQTERVFAGVHEDVSRTPELVDVLLACERLPWYPDALLSLMRAVMRVGRARPEVVSGAEELGRVSHPVQLVWGDRDPFGSVDVARRTARLLPDAELHVVRGGHAPWFDDPSAVARLVTAFLARHAPLPSSDRPRPTRG